MPPDYKQDSGTELLSLDSAPSVAWLVAAITDIIGAFAGEDPWDEEHFLDHVRYLALTREVDDLVERGTQLIEITGLVDALELQRGEAS
jgi:hypothetical protein